MSPLSAREAVKLGYNNVKVLSSGLPGWKKANGLVVLPKNGLKKMIHEDGKITQHWSAVADHKSTPKS